MRIANVRMPAQDELADSDIAGVREELLAARSTLTWQSFLEGLRSGSEVKLYKDNL
ncbi:MAG: hypothetical protein RLW62_11245 [Gammaproteobacteria bacterium]